MSISAISINLVNSSYDSIKDLEHSLKASCNKARAFFYGTGMLRLDFDGSSVYARYHKDNNDGHLTIKSIELI